MRLHHGVSAFSCMSFAAALAAAVPASAQQAESFYKGKTLRIIVGLQAGGLTDLDARLSGRFMVRHLEGNPTLVVQNMPGAGSLKATNHIYNISPKDGTELGAIQRGVVMMPLFGQSGVQFDAKRLTWIGSRSGEISLGVLWQNAPADTLADVRKQEIIVGATGGGADTNEIPLLMNATAGTKFKVVKGYKGGNAINAAIERGEVQGRLGWSMNALMATKSQWVQEGKVKIIMQLALAKHPDLPNVPLALDLALDEERKQVMRLYASRQEFGFPIVGPPDLPAERTKALRAAFAAMTKDPAYLAEAKKMKVDVDPRTGEQLQKLVEEMYATPPQVIARAKELMTQQGIRYE